MKGLKDVKIITVIIRVLIIVAVIYLYLVNLWHSTSILPGRFYLALTASR